MKSRWRKTAKARFAQALTAAIESRYRVGESTNTAFSVTGEPYVEIACQHPNDRVAAVAGTIDDLPDDENSAYLAALSAFEAYAKDRKGVLYWRVRPELNKYGDRYVYYMRLLISDKVPNWNTAA